MALARGFGIWGLDFENVRNICKKARCKINCLKSRIVSLVIVKLGFWTMVIVGKKIGFQALCN